MEENFLARSEAVAMNSYGLAYHVLESRRGIEALTTNLTPVELAALNACMTATPLSKWCDGGIKANMAVDAGLVEQDLVLLGLLRHAVDENGGEILCATVPAIEGDDRP